MIIMIMIIIKIINSQCLEDTQVGYTSHQTSNSFGPIHFVLEHFRLYTLGFEHVGHHVGHLPDLKQAELSMDSYRTNNPVKLNLDKQ